MLTRLLIACAAILTTTSLSQACRYSVRDIGFVDDETAAPSVVISGPTAEVEALEAALRKQAKASGLKPSVWSSAGSVLSACLKREDAELQLALTSTESTDLAESIVAQVALTHFGRDLLNRLIDNPCVVMLIGSEESPNARRAANEGVRRALDESELWAKPMVGEPSVVRLDAKAAAEERVLLWSLGLESLEEPSALVVYGRLRRMGPVLTGDRLTASAVAGTIGLLGKDCECDLDRGVFEGPGVLHAWDGEMAARAREVLEFDPQHPMTELEVRQILAKKTNARRATLNDADVFWGYEEVDLLAAVEAIPEPIKSNDLANATSDAERNAPKPTSQRDLDSAPESPSDAPGAENPLAQQPGRAMELLTVVLVATAASAMTGWFLLRRQND